MRPRRKIAFLLFGALVPALSIGQNAPTSQPASTPTSTPNNNSPFPYGNSQFPNANNNTNTNPYGKANPSANPYGNQSNPYGGNTNPYGNAKTTNNANPYGNNNTAGANPYGNTSTANQTSGFNTNNNAAPNPALTTTTDTTDKPSVAPKILYGGAGLFGVGGLVAAGLAINYKTKAKNITDLAPGEALTPDRANQANKLIQSTKTMAIIADASLGLAVGCAAGGFLLGRDAAVQANISTNSASIAITISR